MLYIDINKSFDELKNTVNKKINLYENTIKDLREENEHLKSEHYKDDEIIRLKQKNEKLHADLMRGFPISESEWKKLKQWQEKHIKEKHNGNTYAGAIGGRFEYYFLPTSIGTVGTCKCSCGKSFVFQEFI